MRLSGYHRLETSELRLLAELAIAAGDLQALPPTIERRILVHGVDRWKCRCGQPGVGLLGLDPSVEFLDLLCACGEQTLMRIGRNMSYLFYWQR